jgi:hypothetical protein
MIASATNGVLVIGSGSIHEFQHPSSISQIIFLFFAISPLNIVSMLGRMPGFRTIYLQQIVNIESWMSGERYLQPSIQPGHLQLDKTPGHSPVQNHGTHRESQCEHDGRQPEVPAPMQ